MSEASQLTFEPNTPGNVNLIYLLYLVSILFGVTAIVGVVMAYLAKDEATPVLMSHYHNQINIFWKMIVFVIASAVLTIVLIGVFTALLALVWYIVRIVKGMQALSRGQAIENPGSWGF